MTWPLAVGPGGGSPKRHFVHRSTKLTPTATELDLEVGVQNAVLFTGERGTAARVGYGRACTGGVKFTTENTEMASMSTESAPRTPREINTPFLGVLGGCERCHRCALGVLGG